MATDVSKSTFASVYKDDFKDSANFHRILFNSGRSLQARELTQMQTIIQKEIERFGNNIFKDGAAVNPISASGVNPRGVPFIKLAATSNDFDGLSVDDLVGRSFVGGVSSVKVRILRAVAATATDPATIYVKYEQTPDANYSVAAGSETLTESATGKELVVATSNATGQGFWITVGGSDFYALGHFVFATDQTIILDKYNDKNIKETIGYIVHEEVVTELDDTSLYDNQGVNPNRAAPGAHRYKIRLELASKSSVAAGQHFVPFLELVNGQIPAVKTGIEDYNKPDAAMAQRTREAEGNFLVSPFKVRMLPGDSAGNLFLETDPFTAYVDGFRVTGGTGTASNPAFNILKPTSVTASSSYNSTPLSERVNLRNYIELDSTDPVDAITFGLLDSVTIMDVGGSAIGKTKIQQYESVGSRYYAYLFNTNMYDGKSIRDAEYIGLDNSTDKINLEQDSNGNALLRAAGGYNFFFPLLKERIQSVSDVTFEVQRIATTSADGSGVFQVSSANDEPFEDEDNWILIDRVTNNVVPYDTWGINYSVSGGGASPYQASISSLTAGRSYTLIYFVDKTDAQYIPKTLTTSTIAAGSLVESGGVSYIDLNDIDIYAFDSVKDSANGVIDLKSNFSLDNGMRDNAYIPGRLLLKGSTLPVSSVYVKYRHFTHGAGDYYSIASYDNASFLQDSDYSYANVPVHTTQSGLKVRLADVIDVRSTYSRAGATTRAVETPRNRSNISYNMSSYNGRIDVLVANKDKTVYIKRGVESLEPTTPTLDPIKELPLYYFNLSPNTLNPQDLRTKMVPHKRFSYKSLTDMENRLKRLEETVALSLLETKTKDLVITNDNGTVRAKAGFFVDNFQYWPNGVASETGPNYNPNNVTQSHDDIRGLIYPRKEAKHADLKYDSDRSTNTKLRGDTVYLKHTEGTVVYDQTDITGVKNVNPFLVGLNLGNMEISPATDNWVDTKNLPANILPDALNVTGPFGSSTAWMYGYSPSDFANVTQPGVFNDTISNDGGQPGETFTDTEFVGRTRNRTEVEIELSTTVTEFTKVTDRITSVTSVTNTESVGEVQYMLPFIRARKIYFRARGLRPNTRHYPYFNGVPVAQWCRTEANYLSGNNRPEADDQFDEVTPTLSEHPSGQTTLTSDTFGTITGSFFLPNTGEAPQAGNITDFDNLESGSTILPDGEAEYESQLAAAVAKVGNGTGITAVKSAAVYNAVGWRFRAGSPLTFELLDTPTWDPANAFSRCEHDYSADVGSLTTTQDNVRTTKTVRIEREETSWKVVEPTGIQLTATPAPVDPIAQTFYVYGADFPQGMYLNSIDVFIYSAPSQTDEQIPITCEVRAVRDGTPVTRAIDGAFAWKSAADVRTAISANATTGITTLTNRAQVLAAPVKFEFNEPIYLGPDDYYSFVLKADTDKYQAWISTVGEYQYGSNSERVSKNNIDGSLFESQNASTWTPLQNSDMAYRLNHLRFVQSGVARFINKKIPRHTFGYSNALSIDSGSNKLFVNHPGHGFYPGDEPKIQGLDSATRYAGILGSTIMSNSLSVDSVDAMGYTLILDSSATDSASFGPADLSSLTNFMYEQFRVRTTKALEIQRTSFDASVKLVSGNSYATGTDTRFNQDNAFTNIPLNKLVLLQEPKMIANDSAENEQSWGHSSTPGGASFMMNLAMSAKQSTDGQPNDSAASTYGKTVSPAIDINDCTAFLSSNLIDNQDSTAIPQSLVNSALKFIPETNPLSGSAPSKHITKPVIIAEPAIGLKILFDAYRPPQAEFEVYYRVCQADENIYDFSWIEVNPIDTGYPPASKVISNLSEMKFLQYEYFAGDETGVTPADDITSFTQFQAKIVMKTKNTAQLPAISNVRLISLVT